MIILLRTPEGKPTETIVIATTSPQPVRERTPQEIEALIRDELGILLEGRRDLPLDYLDEDPDDDESLN